MTEIESKRDNRFVSNLKWYAVGCLVTFVLFYVLEYLKLEMRNIAFCFQTSCGILLGAMFQQRAHYTDKK